MGAVAKTKSMKISVDDAHARDVGSPDTPAAPNEPKQQQQQPHRGQVQWAGAEPPRAALQPQAASQAGTQPDARLPALGPCSTSTDTTSP